MIAGGVMQLYFATFFFRIDVKFHIYYLVLQCQIKLERSLGKKDKFEKTYSHQDRR
jgi:hypothetical protein